MQTCPDPTDGPSIVVNAIEEAHRALVATPSTPLPPVCVISAYAQVPGVMPDSIDAHALTIAAELSRRGASERELLSSEIVLFARARRYADVSRAYDRLVALDPQPSIETTRLAGAAARQRGDTAALLRILTRAASHPDAPPAFRAELNILRQVSALYSAINEARGLVRQNPKYVAAYPSLVGNFGTLGAADSVVAYVRRGTAQGAARTSLAPALDPLVNTVLRHASLYGSTYGWEGQIASAMRVDSVLSTASTKFLVAALIAQSAEKRISEINALVSGVSWLPHAMGETAAPPRTRATGCERIAPLSATLAAAQARLRDGGDRYTGGGVSQVANSLANEQDRLAALRESCARGR
jgi:hypothetical protein